jgi:ribonuclease HII
MTNPDLTEEKNLWEQGYKCIVGVDEAGRGPLAGPVVAAAIKLQNFFALEQEVLKDVKDSKQLTDKKRKEIYKVLTNHPQIEWGIGIVSEKIIDKINILEAAKLAMKKAIEKISDADYLLIDGNFGLNSSLSERSIIKGDQKVFSISAASIIAKVTRDKIMEKYHKKYPQYGFDRNKGYATAEHFATLSKFGPCQIHRKSFYPVSSM